ncbi:hypothetical protein [Methylobacterium sp. SyP6R]|uniref:hypothetical protein n=1 Tax=Methylobacterium sp. SyP6R TaxID=2718876 RepID=UPI001F2ADF99|nr:hypothetical protein [Methylobacterium sp. SyP6R]MCF4124480.1 hypothetical protein [Methylobacterium sp. SyP6R]
MPENRPENIITRLKARYANNAASPDGARTRRAAAVGTIIGVVLLGGYRLVHRASGTEAGPAATAAEASFVQGQLPACDAPIARDLLKQAVETNPSPLLGPVKVHKVGAVTDYLAMVLNLASASGAKLDPNPDANMLAVRANLNKRRSCAAQLFTSKGLHTYNYSIVWTSDANDEIFLQAELGE